jgi:hypothetical protein
MIPGKKVAGAANNSTAANVFRVVFSQATLDLPRMEAWDDYNFSTVANEVFNGTAGYANPMIGAVDTTDGGPAAANWMPTTPTAGAANPNLLKGSTNSLQFAKGVQTGLLAGDDIKFNLNWKLPPNATIPPDLDAVLVLRYSYGGNAPALTWYFNDYSVAAVPDHETAPQWAEFTPGVNGDQLKPADLGSTSNSIVFHRPVSAAADCGEIWVN